MRPWVWVTIYRSLLYRNLVLPHLSHRYYPDVVASPAPFPTADREPKRRGRPLVADRTPLILATVIELLHAQGYDHMRVQDVAERAGVGLGTIYRRWPNKQALVIEALQSSRAFDDKIADTGNPYEDLVLTLQNIVRAAHEKGDVVGFIASLRSEPEVAEVFRSVNIARMREQMRALVARARGVPDDDPGVDLLVDLGPALALFRIAVAGDPVDDAAIERLARAVADLVVNAP